MAYHALMRVISVNVCGIRSAAAKGLFRWLRRQNADFICLQETRSHEDQLAGHDVQLPGYHGFFCDAERKGYAGEEEADRKSTRLNSSHITISYAVFCLKKKKKKKKTKIKKKKKCKQKKNTIKI